MLSNTPIRQDRAVHKKIALTFDDGPNPPFTEQIIAILKQKRVPATFFVCGANTKRYPETVKVIHEHGHLVGNHTYFHHPLTTRLGLSFNEIMDTQTIIDHLIDQHLRLFRPPWGVAPFWLTRRVRNEGFRVVLCDIVGYDWQKHSTPQTITEHVVKAAHDEGIILMHDGKNVTNAADRSKTVSALPTIIDELTRQNFQFVPVLDIHSNKVV